MYRILQYFRDAFRRCDKILLLLCVIANIFGCLVIASTTAYTNSGPVRYVVMQVVASLAGIVCYVIISSIDANFFAEHRLSLVIFNSILLLLIIPFGTDMGSGNRSWLDFPFLPFNIQPAEVCKITYVLIMASVMASRQNNISTPLSVGHMLLHLGLIFGLNMLVSRDMGVSLIFAFIFLAMSFSGGVSWIWYLTGGGLVAIAAPLAWTFVLDGYQRNRIAVLFNPELDPLGTGPLYHTMRALRSLTGGGMTGQGLFQGNRTQNGLLFAQHTDFILSAIGEELGFLGCALALLLLALIVIRCIWVGVSTQDYMRRLICIGTASALIFQIVINVGMNIGVMPVIGLTLPFISYGGSSIISLYAMMGLVSGVFARPVAPSHERYIKAPLKTIHF